MKIINLPKKSDSIFYTLFMPKYPSVLPRKYTLTFSEKKKSKIKQCSVGWSWTSSEPASASRMQGLWDYRCVSPCLQLSLPTPFILFCSSLLEVPGVECYTCSVGTLPASFLPSLYPSLPLPFKDVKPQSSWKIFLRLQLLTWKDYTSKEQPNKKVKLHKKHN